jgi:hypothetical protein
LFYSFWKSWDASWILNFVLLGTSRVDAVRRPHPTTVWAIEDVWFREPKTCGVPVCSRICRRASVPDS